MTSRPIQLSLTLFALAFVLLFYGCSATAQQNNRPPEGFTALFSGRDLDGWDGGEVKSPEAFEKMTYQNWYDYRKRVATEANKHWRVEDGELIGTSGGPDLVTWKHYADFEMRIEWKLTSDSDAGVGLRYGSQIKLWDPDTKAKDKGSTRKGSGGPWTNKTHANEPTARADKPIGEWNRMVIRIVGPYVTVELNGKKVVDNVIFENIFDFERPIDRTGPIHLQSHAGEVRYRNVFIREIKSDESNELLGNIAGDDDKFISLFNGKDLDSWTGAVDTYDFVDGSFRCKRQSGGNILTKKQYGNFIVRLEFKLPPGGNNGILLRAPNTNANHTRDVIELQILDNHHIMHKQLADYQYHGSAYGIHPALRGFLRPTGQWNYQEVVFNEDQIKVILNGYVILDIELKKVTPDHPATSRMKGHLGLTGYSDPVAFRNIRIRELK